MTKRLGGQTGGAGQAVRGLVVVRVQHAQRMQDRAACCFAHLIVIMVLLRNSVVTPFKADGHMPVYANQARSIVEVGTRHARIVVGLQSVQRTNTRDPTTESSIMMMQFVLCNGPMVGRSWALLLDQSVTSSQHPCYKCLQAHGGGCGGDRSCPWGLTACCVAVAVVTDQ
jgi:hypothetical protein